MYDVIESWLWEWELNNQSTSYAHKLIKLKEKE